MAIYKIFPEKSATLYSFYPTLNTGLDEIIEISTFYTINSTDEVSRGVVKFPTNQIQDIIANKVNGKAYDSYLKLYLANTSALPLDYTFYCHPLSGSWNMGTGRLGNVPTVTDGVSWQYRDGIDGSTPWWVNGTIPTGTTGSYRSAGTLGGGLWYTSSQYQATQSFTYITSKDIEFKVSNTVNAWYSSSISNEGFIIKNSPSIEFNPSSSKFETKYFSGNTHTIYPPCLEIRWNDSIYNTGSLSVINSDAFVLSLGNNKGEFQQDSVQRFRINARDKFPARAFITTSVYLNNKALPISSSWSIKDLDSEEIVVDYDPTYTKISCDSSGSYFDVYMNGLEPERYYKLLFKTVLASGETVVSDNNYYFKVIR
jgi:hypothetical protein